VSTQQHESPPHTDSPRPPSDPGRRQTARLPDKSLKLRTWGTSTDLSRCHCRAAAHPRPGSQHQRQRRLPLTAMTWGPLSVIFCIGYRS
jgi:hypothetical protein